MATSPPTLKNFFIYNTAYGTREENEMEKLFFFYPADVSQDMKMNYVGLSEALVKYTSTFSPEQPCEVLRTQKTRQVFLNPEPDAWLSMTVNLPQRKAAEGKGIEYVDRDVQDVVLQSLLEQLYRMYKLFNGTMASTLDMYGRQALVQKLEIFLPRHLEVLDLAASDLLDTFQGIHFLPLEKQAYLKVQCAVNQWESLFPEIKATVFLYNDHLVWSGLEQEDMRILYRYLLQNLSDGTSNSSSFPASTASASAAGASQMTAPVQEMKACSIMLGGQFVTGPEDLMNDETPVNAQRIYVAVPEGTAEVYLIVYKCGSAMCCFMIDGSFLLDIEFYRKLDAVIQQSLPDLDALITEPTRRPVTLPENQHRFVYFNRMNLAQKSSFASSSRRAPYLPPNCPYVGPDLMGYLSDLHVDFERNTLGEDSEVFLKTSSDFWIVGRKLDQRELFVIVNQKNANLLVINEEIKRLSASQLNNIFYFVD